MIRLARRGPRLLVIVVCALAQAALPVQASKADGPPVTRIAFGSCAHQDKPQPIWDAILRYEPDLFIFAGDNVYGDLTPGAAESLPEAYAKAARIEGYRKLRTSVPVLATWDDHDYGQNDAGGDFPYKGQAKALFLDFWQVPEDDPRRSREGVYDARIYGPAGMRLQVILLDLRSFRSPLLRKPAGAPGPGPYMPDPDPAKTMLGNAQWAWLEAQLREPAELRLIVSSVQVLAEGHGYERWGNLPRELDRLLELIASTRAQRVIFLSGDRHVGALYRRDRGVPYPLYEITSSGLNMYYAAASEPGPFRLGAVYGRENFGTIDVDWWAGAVRLAVRALNGEPVREVLVPLAALSGG